jgi:hypothetical protein
MNKAYHILNGDALKERFPDKLNGKIIVARECLVDGPAEGDTPEALYKTRAAFLAGYYGEYSPADYHQDSAAEFEKIRQIPPHSAVYLWFEDDLFCQVNLWFVANLLHQNASIAKVWLVRPPVHTPYGFGGLSEAGLLSAYENRMAIADLQVFVRLWHAYKSQNTDRMLDLAIQGEAAYPFLRPAVQAHLDRIPTPHSPGRPLEALEAIMAELGTEAFVPVFKAFCQRESIYGFGDLQVQRLLEKLKKDSI